MKQKLLQLRTRASVPIDGASLAVLRWMFGWLMFIDALRYLRFGWVKEYYIEPNFHFTYFGFSYVQPLPAPLMYALFLVVAAAGFAMALGFFYRWSGALFTLLFSYIFLLDKAHYLNHFYVIILMAALLTATPAHRLWSLDADAGRVPKSDWIPTWPVWLIRAQLVVIYVYAGIAKLNADWFAGQPLDMWLDSHADLPVIGPVIAGHTFALIASYSGLAIDLILGPLLLVRRARVPALLLMAGFHLANAFLFSIGIFPWMMLGANLIFLDADWPRRLPRFFNHIVNVKVLREREPEPTSAMPPPLGRWGLWLVGLWMTAQLLIPLRHYLYPGDVAWTEEGHRFSWRMKLRDKHGPVDFYLQEPGSDERVPVELLEELTKRQMFKMSCNPDMLLEFAHHLADQAERAGKPRPQVYARAHCALNGHPPSDLIDPNVDLAAQPWNIWPAPWILPESK